MIYERKHIMLREGDFAQLRLIHPELRPSAAIRLLVSNYVDKHAKPRERLNDEVEVNL